MWDIRSLNFNDEKYLSHPLVIIAGISLIGIFLIGALSIFSNNYLALAKQALKFKSTGKGAVQVTLGNDHTCARYSTGLVFCWGYNPYGGTELSGNIYADVSAGTWYTFGLKPDGTVEFWGSTLQFGGPPLPPTGLLFTKISTGSTHACGLTPSGAAYCWGDSQYGKLDVPPGIIFTQIDAGSGGTCGLVNDGSAICWGAVPPPPTGTTFRRVSVGTQLACGLTSSGIAICWGDVYQDPPTGVVFNDIDTGGLWLTCGVKTDGHVQCWGDSSSDSLYAPPTDVTFSQIRVEAGGHVCGITTNETVQCWGENSHSQANDLPF